MNLNWFNKSKKSINGTPCFMCQKFTNVKGYKVIYVPHYGVSTFGILVYLHDACIEVFKAYLEWYIQTNKTEREDFTVKYNEDENFKSKYFNTNSNGDL